MIKLAGVSKWFIRTILRYSITLVAIPILFILKTIFRLQVGYFSSSRIGHFAPDVAWYIATREIENSQRAQDNSRGCVNVFFWEPDLCNEFFEKMVRRTIFAVRVPRRCYKMLTTAPMLHKFWLLPAREKNGSRDPDGRVYRARKILSFSNEENATGRKYLSEKGYDEYTKFVCLLVRDREYLRIVNDKLGQSRDSSYHDYRDSDIETYYAAAEYLAEKGYVVFRMGKHMERPMRSDSQRIIDYAFSAERCDFLDIWLMANCAFCVSTGTGLDAIATIFRRPTLYLNFLPLGDIWSSQFCVTVPKKLYWQGSGRLLSVYEYMEHSYHSSSDYDQNNLEIQALGSDEILNAVIEMDQRVTGYRNETEEVSLSQEQFWQMFCSAPGFSGNHDWINPKARVGADFLAKYGHEFLASS